MRRSTLLFAALALAACEAPLPPGTATARLERQDLALDLRTGEARSTLTLSAQATGGERACFEVRNALPLDGVLVTGVDGVGAAPIADGLEVCGGFGPSDARVKLQARFVIPERTDPGLDVGFSRTADATGRPFTYLLNWVGRCAALGPCDPDPAALTHFTFALSHGREDVALCPGVRLTGAGETRCELLGTLAPTYSALAVASNPGWVRTPFTQGGGVAVELYEVPEGTLRTELDAAAVGDFLDAVTARLGAFPYGDTVRIATGPTQWLGMEHPANLLIREDWAALPPVYADVPLHVVLHELVHQWAGNRTTLRATRDFVWKEAIAEYLTYVFEEARDALAAGQTRRTWHRIAVLSMTYPVPTDVPEPPLETISDGVYGTGPMLLFLQLEPFLGRDAILAGIAAFLAEPGARSVEELRDALEAASGEPLDAYFDAWVFGPGEPQWPSFVADSTQAGDTVQVRLTQQGGREGVVFPCVVEVELRGATSSARVPLRFPLDASSGVATATVTFPEPLTGLAIDPDRRVVDFTLSGGRRPVDTSERVRWHP